MFTHLMNSFSTRHVENYDAIIIVDGDSYAKEK